MNSYRDIELTIADPVALIRLNRPEKLNAFTHDTLAEIRAAVAAAVADARVVGIVITGAGRGFCAGLDARALAEVTATGRRPETPAADDSIPGLFTYFLSAPKPIVAAINGVAAGGGVVLAAMCDVRFASSAARFTTVFLKRGLIAEHGMTWILPRLLGPGRALDLLWSSRTIDGAEAHRVGLVEHLCEPGEEVEQATRYIAGLSTDASPAAIADTKRLVYRHLGLGFPEALRETDAAPWQASARPDAREGARALLERRSPRFERLAGEV